MGLLPLEFTDCLTDSPYFRDNLHAHEKELDRTSQSIKGLTKDVKELISAAKNLSRAQRNFGQGLMNFKFECIGNSQTDDEIIIARSLREIGNLILQIEDERDRVLDRASENFIEPLEAFRKENIGEAKEGKKKFDKETVKFCQSLERYLSLSPKKNDNFLQEADAYVEMEQRNFSQASLQYIVLLQEVQERKKFEFVETLHEFWVMTKRIQSRIQAAKMSFLRRVAELSLLDRVRSSDICKELQVEPLLLRIERSQLRYFGHVILGFMYSWLTFYHQGHEVGKDFKHFMTDLQFRIQKTRDNFHDTIDQGKSLMKKYMEVRKMSRDPGSLSKMYTRQGYLFLLEKKALGTTWIKNFCQYQKENRRFNMIPYAQNAGKITTTDTMVLKTCVRRSSESIDKRFCFDITAEDRPGVITLQALSEEDRRLWLDAMDGKEPTYTPPGKLTKQEESSLDDTGFSLVKKCISVLEQRGLEDQGLYRLVGVNSKVQKLLQMCLDKQQAEKMSLEDLSEWETKTITSAMKSYFRNLPEPVMTFRLYQEFISATKQESKAERVNQIHVLIHQLPQPNFDMLDLLIKHLCNVASKSEKNLMSVSNIGVCFGPTLLRAEEETMAAIMDIKFCNVVVEILIESYEKIFKSLPPQGFDILSNGNADFSKSPDKEDQSHNYANRNSNGTPTLVTSFMTETPMSVQISGIPPPPSVVTRQNNHKNRPVISSQQAQPQQPVAPSRASRSAAGAAKQPLAFINPTCRGDISATVPNSRSSSSESLSTSSRQSSIGGSISSLSTKSSYTGRPMTFYQKSRSDFLGKPGAAKDNGSKGRRVRTLYACVGGNDTELTFEPNQLIENVKPSRDPGWLEGTLAGKTGLIPANYVEYIQFDGDPT